MEPEVTYRTSHWCGSFRAGAAGASLELPKPSQTSDGDHLYLDHADRDMTHISGTFSPDEPSHQHEAPLRIRPAMAKARQPRRDTHGRDKP